MSDPDNPASWLAKARNDLLCIENNLAASEVPWDTVCYHAQQVAEKALKAFLISRQIGPPRTHDLPRLLGLCLAQGADFEELATDCSLVVRYSVASRYPGDPYEPTADEGMEAVEAGRRILQRVQSALAAGDHRDENPVC